MKVKLKCRLQGGTAGDSGEPGDVVDLDKAYAERLIKNRMAEEVSGGGSSKKKGTKRVSIDDKNRTSKISDFGND